MMIVVIVIMIDQHQHQCECKCPSVNMLYKCLILSCVLLVTSAQQCSLSSQLVDEIASYKPVVDQIISSVVNGPYSGLAYKEMSNFVDKFGHRLVGTKNLEDSIVYLQPELEEVGLQVSYDPVKAKLWIRGNESAKVLSPSEFDLDILSLGSSPGTPPEGLVASVLVVNDFDELDARQAEVPGKIVLFNRPFTTYAETTQYRGNGPSQASKYGAVGAIVRSITPFSISSPHTGETNFRDGVKPIPAVAVSLEGAERIAHLDGQGQEVIVRLYLEAKTEPERDCKNLKADLVGSSKPDEFVVLSGHIDSWDVGQGAMDDAGGCYLAWHSAALIHRLQLPVPKRTIRAIFWTGEERGLLGASAYLEHNREELDRWVWAFESDGGVFSPLGLSFNGLEEASCILQEILNLTSAINTTTLYRQQGVGSDISIFADLGVPVAEPRLVPNDYFWYHHSKGDSPMVMTSEDFDANIAMLASTSYVLADLSTKLPRSR